MALQQFQLDIAARIESSAFFADVPVFVFRPRESLTAAEIQDRINAALGPLTPANGKSGLAVTVLMPTLETKERELPGPYFHLTCIARVQENVVVNMGATGTQIPCEDAAIALSQVLHLWTPGGVAGIIHVATETIKSNSKFEGRVTYDVTVESELNLPCLEKTALPIITEAAGNITVTSAASGAAIYYTLDGSAPWAGNAGAILYAAPFAAPPAGTLVRAVAFDPALLPSDTGWLQM